jgi:protein-tyrosine phosphatase
VVEIHYHLIFGVDDGPECLEESLALAQVSIEEGVTHIVATPHANSEFRYRPEVNRERLAIIEELLGGQLELGIGCDFHLSQENLADLRAHPTRYTVNGKQYLLAEFPDDEIPASFTQVFEELIDMGIVPIITHPERNRVILNDPNRLNDWIRCGCLLQVTGASLRGRFGSRAQALALELIRRNWVHIVASDAHALNTRSPCMGRAHEILSKEFGFRTADRLCRLNPRAVFYGEPLPQQPRPANIDGEERQGFLAKVFGK